MYHHSRLFLCFQLALFEKATNTLKKAGETHESGTTSLRSNLTNETAMSDLLSKVEFAIREHVAPALELAGEAIEVLDVDRGCVRVRLHGACAGCSATIMLLIHAIEAELRKHVPEIEYLEAAP